MCLFYLFECLHLSQKASTMLRPPEVSVNCLSRGLIYQRFLDQTSVLSLYYISKLEAKEQIVSLKTQ